MAEEFEEIECKFLDIDVEQVEQKLAKAGAKRQFHRLFRRYVLDFPDLRLNSQNAWLRVRDEGDKTTLTFKQRTGVGSPKADGGMREIEVKVSDFERTIELLKAIGMKPKFYEENRRTLYLIDDVEVAIDEWPLIPPYIEIEGPSWEKVEQAAKALGFDPDKKLVCSTMQVYERYGINEHDYSILTFSEQKKSA